ncbi:MULTISPECIES: LysR family transcriptional regulator [Streptomyces]|uniref:LysR family transcriptional regulator n=1 Tax=Streptomyces TaxID=1883 RepID=UPI00068CD681|nr:MULTISPECIES: LysR family transcriptional regulator [Streptomyces]QHF97859.1 LysR family transcriptional regulator [Streptomyces sp. NHF165]
MDLDLDLALVRSFVVTAEEMHFRRAAERIGITQQAISQRVRRLESQLGAALFHRGPRSVELTDAGQRFLGPARDVLAAARAAAEAVRPPVPHPLRVDVVDGRLAPLHLVRALLEEDPALPVNLSMRQALHASLPALVRGEIDCAFGRVHPDAGIPPEATSRLVRLEPVCALLPRTHPLADRDRLTMADLRQTGIWMPHYGQESEWNAFVRQLAEEFGLSLTLSGPALSEEHFVELLWEHGEMACPGGADVSYSYSPDIRCLPLVEPRPVYPWSLVWLRQHRHPLVQRMIGLARAAATEWLACDPSRDWLPGPDRALLGVFEGTPG